MKRFLKPSDLTFVVLCSALLTYIARILLLVSAIGDERGLLPVGSLPDILSWVLVAVTMGILLVTLWPIDERARYGHQERATSFAAVFMCVAAACFCITSVLELCSETDMVSTISAWMGFLAAASLGILAWSRIKDKKVTMIFHGIVCLYLILHLVSHYRLWSSSPQLQSYAFELLAIVFVMLACYHRTTVDAGHGKYRSYTLFSLAAAYFCVAALPGCDNPVFFLGCALWMFFTPCHLPSYSQEED